MQRTKNSLKPTDRPDFTLPQTTKQSLFFQEMRWQRSKQGVKQINELIQIPYSCILSG